MGWQGHQIQALAKSKGMTLKDLASQVGVSRQALTDWRSGKIPKGGHLLKLCRALGVGPEALFSSEADSRITVPMHRTRKTAKLNGTMQSEAKDLAKGYELFFREASDPGLVQSLRIFNRTDEVAHKSAHHLRQLCEAEGDNPITFDQAFDLIKKLGVNLIFTDFHESIKAYAFYTKINNHRVVFVNFDTKIIDLIFGILHEATHSIRDESNAYDNSYVYEQEEEDFCDLIAGQTQLPDSYFTLIQDTVSGLAGNKALSIFAKYGQKYNHSLHPIKVRLPKLVKKLKINPYKTDTRMRTNAPTVRNYFFEAKDARDYVRAWQNISPVFLIHLVEQSDNLSSRRIGELLSIESELDAAEAKKELIRMKNGD